MGYLHPPRNLDDNQSPDEDEELTEDELHESEEDEGVQFDPADSADIPPKNLGIVSRRLFSNVGVNKQSADGGGSHKVSAKEKVTIVSTSLLLLLLYRT